MAASKNKTFVLFFLAIIAISLFMFMIQLRSRRVPRISVPGNRGISELFTLEGRLTAVFQDGRVCAWDWDIYQIKQTDFTVGSGRAIPLADGRLAAIARLGDRRVLSVYDLDAARKLKDLTVGWDDQDILVRTPHDRSAPAVIRRNAERNNLIEYEFLIVDLDAEILRPAVVQMLSTNTQVFRDFAVSDAGVLVAAGADNEKARLLAIDLNTGQTLWDQIWPEVEELMSVAISLDGRTVWAGDRGGNLLTIVVRDGQLQSTVSLLQPGETRTVTNDFSVLNLVLGPDGRRLGCTIAPIAYVVDAETGRVTHRFDGHKVVSKIAFSPDSRKLATGDLRADGVIRIRTLE